METTVLSYGDNLDILRRDLPDAAVDLVYLDPPFTGAYAVNGDWPPGEHGAFGGAFDVDDFDRSSQPQRGSHG